MFLQLLLHCIHSTAFFPDNLGEPER